ncbi:OadG family protein [Tetragenococcus halophilus]|uniref:OadG family protein n=1 Tax=Tetragenococcus halophilus TaxID=51669 RepID=UPI001F20F2E9|nr:OadG family protein [Tetragenococcus halophilus]MCF1684586.1 OadG family protein [Tetragenococcus halophilus]
MTNFTIMDGLMLMIVAMAAVFAVLMGLWGLLVIVRKLTIEKENNQPLPTSNQAASSVSQEKSTEETSEQGTIPPEKVALIMSLLVDKHKRDKN